MDNNNLSSYNGWSSRETWLTGLWLSSDPASYALIEEAVSRRESIPLRAEWLSEQVQESIDELGLKASLVTDLLSTALRRVNWREIIESNLE